MNLVDVVNQDHANPNVKALPDFRTGDTVAVHAFIKEGDKKLVQIFQGTVIAIKRQKNYSGSYSVRKVSDGVGVERLFPFHSPNVQKVEIVQRGKAARAKLYYLRERLGKSARVQIDYDR
ncbi:MAG: 50S ribosomal protein L19 [Bdellovibrionota bacterium]